MSTNRQATVYSEALPSQGGRLDCQLVVIEGPDVGRAARVLATGLIAGTDPTCQLVLTDERVSGRHLELQPRAPGEGPTGYFSIRDLGSKNGIVYEGSVITDAVVPVGATLRLGRTYVRIQPVATPLDLEPSQARRFGELVAESLAMREVFAVLELAAASDVTVLLEGETGTGKELTARAIHEHSARRKGPFVAVDCGALPETLLESELMGHVRGAFTGATGPREGAFARADGGTLFLDELGQVSAPVQARLLRVIEERRVKAVGADRDRPVDLRIIGASMEPLDTLVARGDFRADLFYRLSVVRVSLPPLRARREDLAPIVAEMMRRRGLDPGPIGGSNLDALMAHDWRGNVRELRNVIDRAIALSPGAESFSQLRLRLTAGLEDDELAVRADLPFAEAKQAVLHAFERRYLRDALARCGGNISATSRETGVDRKHLRTLLKKHGLIPDATSDTDLD